MSFPYVLIFHVILQFSNSVRHDSGTDCQKSLLAEFRCFRVFLVPFLYLPHAFLWRGPVFLFLLLKFFRHSTSYFFKIRYV